MASNERPEKLRAEMIARNQIGSIHQQVREHKTLDALLGKAKVTDVDPEEFAKEREAASTKKGESKPKKPAPPHKAKEEEPAEPKAEKKAAEKAPAKKPAKKSGK
jgi:hypothetical protein